MTRMRMMMRMMDLREMMSCKNLLTTSYYVEAPVRPNTIVIPKYHILR